MNKTVKKALKNPMFLGMALIIVFFIAYIGSSQFEIFLPVFVICTISVILSCFALVFNFTFLNSIVIGYWAVYLVTIADAFFEPGGIGIHLTNLVLATIVLIKRWKNSWPWLIFLSGFLWATVIGTGNQISAGEVGLYFQAFEGYDLLALYITFDAFMAIVIYLAQNPKKRKTLLSRKR